jgi:hypothetical protein
MWNRFKLLELPVVSGTPPLDFTYVPDYTRDRSRGGVPDTTGNSNNLNLFHICTRLYQNRFKSLELPVVPGTLPLDLSLV